jgi:Na+-driven multidrug efflux pump
LADNSARTGRIGALALPALVVLAAEPLYLLFDTAVVGRLGAMALAGLAIGGLIVSMVGSGLSFCRTAPRRALPGIAGRAIGRRP